MAFWHYHTAMTSDRAIQPLDPVRRIPYVRSKVATSKQADGHPNTHDFETTEAVAAYQQQSKGSGKRKRAVIAEQIMSGSVVSIDPQSSLAEARKVVGQRRFRHVPVVTPGGRICGIVSDRDLFALVSRDDAQEVLEAKVVADIMTRRVLTATADTNIREIARVLFEERIGCMPIVNQEDQVIGIITRSDILRALIKHAPLDLWI